MNFDQGTELASQFNYSGFSQTTTNVVGNAGGALRASGDGLATFKGETFSLSNDGDKFVTSVFVRRSGQPTSSSRWAALGVGDELPANGNLFGTASVDGNAVHMISARIETTANTDTYRFQFQQRDTSLGNATDTGSSFTVVNGWYKFEMVVELLNLEQSRFKLSGSLQSYGTDGTVAGDVIASFDNVELINNGLAANLDTLYGGLRGVESTSGAARWDNYSAEVVVPEPAGAALIGVAAAGLLRRRRAASAK